MLNNLLKLNFIQKINLLLTTRWLSRREKSYSIRALQYIWNTKNCLDEYIKKLLGEDNVFSRWVLEMLLAFDHPEKVGGHLSCGHGNHMEKVSRDLTALTEPQTQDLF